MEISLAVFVFFPFVAGMLAYVTGRTGLNKGSEGNVTGEKVKLKKLQKLQKSVVIGTTVLEFAGMAMLSGISIRCGKIVGEQAVMLEIPGFCGLGISFVLDGFRAIYGCVAVFMWMMASVFSGEYFEGHRKNGRFYLFFLWTLGATLGVFLSADLYTTFLFFEVMSFTSYVWVAQEEDKASLRAAGTYLAVAVLGGLVMLMGIFLLQYQLGTLKISELAAAAAECADKKMLYAAGVCMLFGFGAKAGVFPLHIWLPKAHPVAPAPASALLSGILTKTGIYGILIISCALFPHDSYWCGLVLALGVITMFGGAFLAVFSIDLKRTLACSSMSQIGFILVGIGMLGLSGARTLGAYDTFPEAVSFVLPDVYTGTIPFVKPDTLAMHGVFLHMVNHSLIKLVLFLAAGVIHKNIHSMDLNVIRGFGRKKPVLAGSFLTGALAISGVPFFGGYISKTLLHESIVEYGGGNIMRMVERLFLFSGGLTVAYMTKLFVAIFVEKNGDEKKQESYDGMKCFQRFSAGFAVAGSALVLLVWGLLPYVLMEKAAQLAEGFFDMRQPWEGFSDMVQSAGGYLSMEAANAGDLVHEVSYFSFENLKGGLISIVIGVAVYLLFVRKVLMKKTENSEQKQRMCGTVYVNLWPRRLDLEELIYRPLLLKILPAVFAVLCRILDSFVDAVVMVLRRTVYRNSPLPHERLEGNAFTERLGKLLNLVQSIGNHTWRRGNTVHRDYVHLAALKNEEFKENNLIIRRSLSFGLLLFCIGLSLTLMYLIWF